MIIGKSQKEIEKMRASGQLVGQVLRELKAMVEPGLTTIEADMAAEKMINSLIDDLINAGKLQSADGPGKPAILAISRIVNNTAQQIDTDLLIKQIRVALNKTGKVVTSTTMGFGGPEDPLAKDAQQEKEIAGNQRASRRPDYTLSGKIIDDRAREGNVRESTYSFQLSLSTPDGLAVWEDLKNITKQGKRPNAGW